MERKGAERVKAVRRLQSLSLHQPLPSRDPSHLVGLLGHPLHLGPTHILGVHLVTPAPTSVTLQYVYFISFL